MELSLKALPSCHAVDGASASIGADSLMSIDSTVPKEKPRRCSLKVLIRYQGIGNKCRDNVRITKLYSTCTNRIKQASYQFLTAEYPVDFLISENLETSLSPMDNSGLYLLLADVVLGLHICVVVFTVFGLVLVLIGGALKWSWVKNPWFRSLHLLCISIVVLQAWVGIVCPLTTLEMWLRDVGGDKVYAGSFITYWMQSLLYYDAPAWVFTVVYTVFGLLVFLSYHWVRPRKIK